MTAKTIVGRLAPNAWRTGDPLPEIGSICLVSGANCDVESDQHRSYMWRKVVGYGDGDMFVCLQTEGCWPTVERTENCWFAEIPVGRVQQTEPVGDERAAFENLYESLPDPVNLTRHELAWRAWQARAAQSGQRAGVAEGWCFYSADFSMNAANPAQRGTVMLIRDDAGRKWWHGLDEDEREKIALLVSGHGLTFDTAMQAANSNAIAAAPTPAAQGGA